ncbi:hypothetical protein AURDEDRAFT_161853 [Auricularia subglabra TFB-10046 SS5]|nr:hypothetical protein AURDEDRAFT_161853 [Auricularia subglabra TFB-10046 SS5]
MAGDHKCPVCQSTFTRPQHVARHMRSHTGDRPYKCTTCGDQFARSDLLSRHVNKCHAADRPQNSTSRRRGSNTARAHAQQQAQQAAQQQAQTTVRQCDQCGQTGAACDLRAPCTSCSQRRLQCTYIRAAQQAGLKPGDQLSFSASSFASGGLSLPSMLSADPLYGANISDPGLSNFSSNLFAIPSLAHPTDLSSHRTTSALPLPPAHASLNALDIPLHMYPSLPTAPSPASSQLSSASGSSLPLPPAPGASHSNSANLTGWQGGSGDLQALGHSLHAPRASNMSSDFLSGYDSYDSRPSTGSLPSPRSLIDMTQPPVDLYGYRRGHSHSQSDSGTHSDFSASSSPALGMRGSGFSTHASLPSTHDVFAGNQAPPNAEDQQQLPRMDPQSYMLSGHNMQVPRNDGQVSNAFGMLSLEELRNQAAGGQFSFNPPPLDAGNNTDLGPWSRPNSQHDMPRPSSHDGTVSSNTGASGASGPRGSEQNSFGTTNGAAALSPATEARQMKEFWKAFMCDPYATGQTPDTETPGAMKTPLANGRPGYIRMHSLSKSASLPPLRRNPSASERLPSSYDDSTPHASMAQQLGHAHNTALPPKSIVNPADLRSYEEAIRSRPPPVLKFDPRMRGGQPDHGAATGIRLRGGGDESEGTSSDVNLSRRPSVADAGDPPQNQAMKPDPGADDGSRPSFKRLASQTLGPTYSKRAAHTKLGAIGDAANSPSAESASGGDGDGDDEKSARDDSSDEEQQRRGRPFDRGLPSVHNVRNGAFNVSASGRTMPVTSA